VPPVSNPPVPFEVPARLLREVGARRGPAGIEWAERLPGLAAEFLERWSLTDPQVVQPGGRSALVLLVRRADGTPAALKLCSVGRWNRHEAAALRCWGGHGAARLLEQDAERGVLLLERLSPAVSLRSLREDRAMLEAAEVLRRLWVAPAAGHPFESVGELTEGWVEWLRAYRERPDAEPGIAGLAADAMAVRAELVADGGGGGGGGASGERLLLHGDFHQGDVLAGEREPWTAIAPRPVVGERAYDLARLVRDRLETLLAEPSAEAAVRRRLHRLADSLEVERARLRGWALVRATAAGVRALEAGAGAGKRARAELLLELAAYL
jgi:streptomycin 6-kinase